jgi:hypothetical protein
LRQSVRDEQSDGSGVLFKALMPEYGVAKSSAYRYLGQ